jgi:hypothetical protein
MLKLLVAMLALSSAALAEGEYRHFVFFKFKPDTPEKEVTRIESEFAALPSKIDTITGFEWGTNVSPENKAKGFTHGFTVTFKDKAGLETYIPHPAHEKFVEGLVPHLDDVFVFDYVAK